MRRSGWRGRQWRPGCAITPNASSRGPASSGAATPGRSPPRCMTLISGSGPRSPEMGRPARIAVSGHRGLPAGTADLIGEAIRVALGEQAAAVAGLSCLADGADQIFARAVLDAGGEIEAVVPALKYREGLPADAIAEYDALLARAVRVHRLPFTEFTSEGGRRCFLECE